MDDLGSCGQSVWDFLENGRPAVHTFKHEGSYTDQVMLALNDIMGGNGVGRYEVGGEVLAKYVILPDAEFRKTVVYDERSGGYWVMRAADWSPV